MSRSKRNTAAGGLTSVKLESSNRCSFSAGERIRLGGASNQSNPPSVPIWKCFASLQCYLMISFLSEKIFYHGWTRINTDKGET
jgi:hypothetical protein